MGEQKNAIQNLHNPLLTKFRDMVVEKENNRMANHAVYAFKCWNSPPPPNLQTFWIHTSQATFYRHCASKSRRWGKLLYLLWWKHSQQCCWRCIYHLRMRVGNVFSHVCQCVRLSVCLSVGYITFEPLCIGTLVLVWRYIFTISRSNFSIKVIGSMSYAKRDYLHS